MKALLAYLLFITTIYYTLRLTINSPQLLSIPYLANYQSLLIFNGELNEAHPSLTLYQRIYLLSDQATSTSIAPQPIRLFSRPQQMTGIIYTYGAFEVGPEAMRDGFISIGNLQRFRNRTMLVPLNVEKCLGEWQRRQNGVQVCKLVVNDALFLDIARRELEKIRKQIISTQDVQMIELSQEQSNNQNVMTKEREGQHISQESDKAVMSQQLKDRAGSQHQVETTQQTALLEPIEQSHRFTEELHRTQAPIVRQSTQAPISPQTAQAPIVPQSAQAPIILTTQQAIVNNNAEDIALANNPNQDPILSPEHRTDILSQSLVQPEIELDNKDPRAVQVKVEDHINLQQAHFQFLQQDANSERQIGRTIISDQSTDGSDEHKKIIDNQITQEEEQQSKEQRVIIPREQIQSVDKQPSMMREQSDDRIVEVQSATSETLNANSSDKMAIPQQDTDILAKDEQKNYKDPVEQIKQLLKIATQQPYQFIIHTASEHSQTQLLPETSIEKKASTNISQKYISEKTDGAQENNTILHQDTETGETAPTTVRQTAFAERQQTQENSELLAQQQNTLNDDTVVGPNNHLKQALPKQQGHHNIQKLQGIKSAIEPNNKNEGDSETGIAQISAQIKTEENKQAEEICDLFQQISGIIEVRSQEKIVNKQEDEQQQLYSDANQQQIQQNEQKLLQQYQQTLKQGNQQIIQHDTSLKEQSSTKHTTEILNLARKEQASDISNISNHQQPSSQVQFSLEASIELEDHLSSINSHLSNRYTTLEGKRDSSKKWTIPISDGQPSDLVVQLPRQIDNSHEQASSSFLELNIRQNTQNHSLQAQNEYKNPEKEEQRQQRQLNSQSEKTQENVNTKEDIVQAAQPIGQGTPQNASDRRQPDAQVASQAHSQPHDQAMYI